MAAHSFLALFPPIGWKRIRSRAIKLIYIYSQYIYSLISERNTGEKKKSKGNHSPPPTNRPMPSHCLTHSHLERQNRLFIAEHDITWYGISLWPMWVCCPGYGPTQFLDHLRLFTVGREWEKEKALCNGFLWQGFGRGVGVGMCVCCRGEKMIFCEKMPRSCPPCWMELLSLDSKRDLPLAKPDQINSHCGTTKNHI